MSEKEFQGRVVAVTGGAGGIGTATVKAFARAGGRVAMVDREAAAPLEAAQRLRSEGFDVTGYTLDITNEAACRDFAAKLSAEIGPCAVLVNNAGVLLRKRMTEPGVRELIAQTFNVNVFGMLNMTFALAADLKAQHGAIINVASTSAFVVGTTGLAYGPSKAAVVSFTQSLAQELAPDGVRVNAVAPGPTMTSMTAATRSIPERSELLMSRTVLRRYADPSEIAEPIVFLASRRASFITGATLAVDGGYLAS